MSRRKIKRRIGWVVFDDGEKVRYRPCKNDTKLQAAAKLAAAIEKHDKGE